MLAAQRYVLARERLEGAGSDLVSLAVDVDAAWGDLYAAVRGPQADHGPEEPYDPPEAVTGRPVRNTGPL